MSRRFDKDNRKQPDPIPESQSMTKISSYPKWVWVFTGIVFLIFLGLMIWMAVEIGLIAPYLNGWPSAGCVGDYVVLQGVAAEPYSGPRS